VAAALLLAGCAVDPKREVATYRQVLDPGAPATQPYDSRRLLTLSQALALANQNDERLGRSGEDYVQSLIDKNRAVAAFLPTVSLMPSYATPAATAVPGAVRTSKTTDNLQVPLVGSWNVFRGGGDTATLHASEATIAQHRELLLDLQATVLLNVAQTYYQVLRSEQQVEVLSHSLQVQNARVADMQQRLANGLATQLEVAQTRAQADATEVALIQARTDAADGRILLAFLIGVPAVDGALQDDLRIPEPVPPLDDFEQQALAHRQDLHAAQDAVRAARFAVDAAIAEYYPSVSLNAAAFLTPEWLVSPAKWNSLLVANLPIFTAGIIAADVRTAWSRLRQAALTQQQTRRQIHNDVHTAYQNLADNLSSLRKLADQVAAARDAYDQARSAYDNGLAINLDVLTAQDQYQTAQLQLVSTTLDRRVLYCDLVRTTGALVTSAATAPATAPPAAGAP
jgi:outer membrane protein